MYKPDSYNNNTLYPILCKFPLCHQNSSDPWMHGLHKNSEGVLQDTASKTLVPDPLSPVSCKGVPQWIRLVCPAHPTDTWIAYSTP